MYVVSEDAVRKIVDEKMAYDAIAKAFIAAHKGTGKVFPVVHAKGCDGINGFSMKSGNLSDLQLSGLKVGSHWPQNHQLHGVPNHGTTTLLLDEKTGFPYAVLNAGYLNGLRTAAANAVATNNLVRKGAHVLGVIGAGHQAIFEIKAICKIRDIDKILIHSRNAKTVDHAIEELAKDGVAAEHCEVETLCRNADVLVTVTGARGPLFDAEWIKPGTHVSAMGADQPGKQELPVGLLEQASLYADYPPQSIINGEFEAIYNKNNAVKITAIGAVLTDDAAGRTDEDQITVFDSSGIGLQDLSVAKAVLDQAITKNLVSDVEF